MHASKIDGGAVNKRPTQLLPLAGPITSTVIRLFGDIESTPLYVEPVNSIYRVTLTTSVLGAMNAWLDE